MNYPIVIHKDRGSDYGVIVPDLPGCYSAGKTIDDALQMAREAIELHLEGLIEEGKPVPRPATIDAHHRKSDYKGGTWALVSVDPATLRSNAKRINITVPERVLDAVDGYARKTGDTRSGLLVRAATQYIGRNLKSSPLVKRGRRPKRRIKSHPQSRQ